MGDTLHAAIGRYDHNAALFDEPTLAIEPFPAINRAFRPMVRDAAFEASEMAIATFLMAKAQDIDLVLLPVVMVARFQNRAFIRRADDPFGPGDLPGKRIAIRAYSQTTALWLRGAIAEEYGVTPERSAWVTFEDAHVPHFTDPPWCERAPAGSDMLAMLKDGTVDAAILGNDVPDDPALSPIFPDPDAAGRAFFARHGLMPVNHMVVVRGDVAARRGTVRRLMDMVHAAHNPYPFGRQALDPAVALALRYCTEQGLLKRAFTLDEAWAGLPPGCEE